MGVYLRIYLWYSSNIKTHEIYLSAVVRVF